MRRLMVLGVAVLAVGGCGGDKKPAPGWSLRSAATAHLRALDTVNHQLAQAYRADSLRTAQRAHAPAEVFAALEGGR